MSTNRIKRCNPKYTLEFKQDAVRLVLEKGYSHQQAANSLRISLSAIGRWVRAERGSVSDGEAKKVVLNLADQAELVALAARKRTITDEARNHKKGRGLLCQGNRMKYEFIREQQKTLSIDRIMSGDAGEHQCLLYVA